MNIKTVSHCNKQLHTIQLRVGDMAKILYHDSVMVKITVTILSRFVSVLMT